MRNTGYGKEEYFYVAYSSEFYTFCVPTGWYLFLIQSQPSIESCHLQFCILTDSIIFCDPTFAIFYPEKHTPINYLVKLLSFNRTGFTSTNPIKVAHCHNMAFN